MNPPAGPAPSDAPEQRDRGLVFRAWLANTRQELSAPAEALCRYAEALRDAVPQAGPPKFVKAVANVALRSGQLRDLVTQLLSAAPAPEEDEAACERHVRHELRGHAAYIIGMSRLWLQQAGDPALALFAPALGRIQTTAEHVVTLLDKLVAFNRGAAQPPEPEGLAQIVRFMEELPASQERGRLLVVDDNDYNRDYLCDLLTRQGHEVLGARDGEEALERLADWPFDLILLDVLMPGLGGFGLLERLKASELWRHIPVIMISALGETHSVLSGIARGAEDYLTRPVDPLLLRARIGACLEKKRLRDREMVHLRRIDELLHAIFPPEVVDELKETSSIRPRRHERVGVFFLDVVGFTAFCDAHRDEPEEVVRRLQELFLAFERIARRHGVQKIKTIGDAFLGVAGLLRPCANPVLTLLRCGADMIAAAQASPSGWRVRSGIHVGPVIAGVLGETQYSFDLWGDTVNIAARMESCGRPDTITLSARAWEEVKAVCEGERRWADVRGIGSMEVYDFRGFREGAG